MEYLIYGAMGWMSTFMMVAAIIVLFVKTSHLKKEQKEIRNLMRESGKGDMGITKAPAAKQKNFSEKIVSLENSQPFVVESDYKKSSTKAFTQKGDSLSVSEKVKVEKSKSEFNIGSRIIPAIGVVSIFLGAAFFLKYAIDHDLISKTGRVILGFITGVSFIVVGELIRKKFLGYSALLVGGGFALLYLSAKFGLIYELYTELVSFAIMATVTAVAIAVAYRINSKVVAFVSLVGGFITPVLAWNGAPQEMLLFNYMILLLGGMMFLAWKKNWMSLVTFSAIGTISLYAISFSEHFTNSYFWMYWIYLIIFFAIFTISPFLFYFFNQKEKKKTVENFIGYGNIVLIIVAGGIFMSLSYAMFAGMARGEYLFNEITPYGGYQNENPLFENLYFLIALVPAIFYIVLSKISLGRLKEKESELDSENITGEEKKSKLSVFEKPVYLFLALASFAIALIPALQFSGSWITFAWLLEALVLALITYKTKIQAFLYISYLVLTAGLLRMLTMDSYEAVEEYVYAQDGTATLTVTTFTPLFNERALIFLIGVSVTFVIAYISLKRNQDIMAKVFAVVGNLVVLLWIYLELISLSSAGYWGITSDIASVLLSVIYLVYASVIMYIGIVKKYASFRVLAIGIFLLVVFKTYFIDIWNLHQLLRVAAFVVLGVVALAVGYYYNKHKEKVVDFIKGE